MKAAKAHPFDKLAKPARRALANAGIQSLEQLAGLSQAEFIKLHGIGKNALAALQAALADEGLHFKQ